MKRHLLDWVVVCLSIALFCAYLVWKEGLDTMRTILSGIDYRWIVIAMASMLTALLCETAVLVVIRRRYQDNVSYGSCFRSTVVGYMFGAITPLQIGNIASQITILTKDGMKAGDAATVLLTKTILFVCSMVAVVGALIALHAREFSIPVAFWVLICIGLAGNALYLAFLLSVAKAERLLGVIAGWFIRLLGRFHAVRQPQALQEKAVEELHQMKLNMAKIRLRKRDYFLAFVFGCLQLVFTYQICYFIYRGFSLSGQGYSTVLAAQAFSAMIQSIVPIPGGLGVADSGFYYIMVQIMGDAFINFAMVLWRLLTLYLPILLGLVALMTGRRRNKDGVR